MSNPSNRMKTVQLIHNSGAGDEQHSEKHLLSLLEGAGYQVSYLAADKKTIRNIDGDSDLVVIAGGDGTVRKVAAELLKGKLIDRPARLALLPLGTANNIARSLGISNDLEQVVQRWSEMKIRSFDVGHIRNLEGYEFFLEGFGYGAFPYLMQEMKKRKEEDEGSPEERIRFALQVMHEILQDYKPRTCRLNVNGKDFSGRYLLAEVMNIPSIGPNLFLAPGSDPSDGLFEVVLVPEHQKDEFLAYIESKIAGREQPYAFQTIRGRDIQISWEGSHVHVDDQVVKVASGTEITIRLKNGLFEFLDVRA
jgi:diacylglycerol kinase (ATP)